jgi:hypothetical protein
MGVALSGYNFMKQYSLHFKNKLIPIYNILNLGLSLVKKSRVGGGRV